MSETIRYIKVSMKKVVIIGAGPAGLAAGDHLCLQGVKPLILEKGQGVGGLSRTFQYRGCRFDIGGHRFFTKNAAVFHWWQGLLKDDFMVTSRSSKIYYKGAYFNYPLSIKNVLARLGIRGTAPIVASYLLSRVFPRQQEDNFEQWVINRFGKRLYRIFFKGYTEKVWGIPCNKISSDWASQRIKGLSLSSAARNALAFSKKNVPKTLIKEFHFPRLGAGMMYDAAARRIMHQGGDIRCGSKVTKVFHSGRKITAVMYHDSHGAHAIKDGVTDLCSSMPLPELINSMEPLAPEEVRAAASRLCFRSLVVVGLIINRQRLFEDTWIYVNSRDVLVGRVSNFKNWNKDMVENQEKTALGLEYFCTQNDEIWNRDDQALIQLAAREMEKLHIIKGGEVEDGVVVRVPNAYPVYGLGYRSAMETARRYVLGFSNLHCMGRYGMFRYNNMDHSIVTGFLAARNVLGAHEDIWQVNAEESYHEEWEAKGYCRIWQRVREGAKMDDEISEAPVP